MDRYPRCPRCGEHSLVYDLDDEYWRCVVIRCGQTVAVSCPIEDQPAWARTPEAVDAITADRAADRGAALPTRQRRAGARRRLLNWKKVMRFLRWIAWILGALVLCCLINATSTPAQADAPVSWAEVEQWTRADAARFGVSADWLLRVAVCESSRDVLAVGAAGEIGPAQFHPRGIWWDLPESRLVPLDFSRTSLRMQIQAFARAFSLGLWFYWSCAR